MINKDTYKQVQIAILSGVAEYKDDKHKEVWWKDKDYYGKTTIELLDDERLVEREYHENGNVYLERNYKNGQLDGIYISYYEDGSIGSKGRFKDGKEDGEFIDYDINGNICWTGSFKNGKPVE